MGLGWPVCCLRARLGSYPWATAHRARLAVLLPYHDGGLCVAAVGVHTCAKKVGRCVRCGRPWFEEPGLPRLVRTCYCDWTGTVVLSAQSTYKPVVQTILPPETLLVRER